MSKAMNVSELRQAVERLSKVYATPLTKEEIRKDREYWGSMPWHPPGMKHPALKPPRSRNKKVK